MEKEKIVDSVLYAVATEELTKEVLEELDRADPSEEAIAEILKEQDN